MKRATSSLFAAVLVAGLQYSACAGAYDFSYSYADPSLAASQTYIASSSNVSLLYEAPVWYWHPTAGGSAFANTTPGVIVYHFPFAQAIEEAYLYSHNPTFHWSYSQGHNFLWASSDGSNWVQLLDVAPPAFGGANGGYFNGLLPSAVLGDTDLWIKVELYSYGLGVDCCGPYGTNTAQHSRWGPQSSDAFRLGINFASVGPPTPSVPEPGTLALFGIGLALLAASRRRTL